MHIDINLFLSWLVIGFHNRIYLQCFLIWTLLCFFPLGMLKFCHSQTDQPLKVKIDLDFVITLSFHCNWMRKIVRLVNQWKFITIFILIYLKIYRKYWGNTLNWISFRNLKNQFHLKAPQLLYCHPLWVFCFEWFQLFLKLAPHFQQLIFLS